MLAENVVAVNEALAVFCVLVSLLLLTVACTEPVPTPLGVTTMTTVAREPDCSVGMTQATALLTGVLQVPEPAVALVKVAEVLASEGWGLALAAVGLGVAA